MNAEDEKEGAKDKFGPFEEQNYKTMVRDEGKGPISIGYEFKPPTGVFGLLFMDCIWFSLYQRRDAESEVTEMIKE